MTDRLIELIDECLQRGISVEIVRCGQYARPGKPYLCRCREGVGIAERDHLVYGDNAEAIMREGMQHVLRDGFTQPQDRYGLFG